MGATKQNNFGQRPTVYQRNSGAFEFLTNLKAQTTAIATTRGEN